MLNITLFFQCLFLIQQQQPFLLANISIFDLESSSNNEFPLFDFSFHSSSSMVEKECIQSIPIFQPFYDLSIDECRIEASSFDIILYHPNEWNSQRWTLLSVEDESKTYLLLFWLHRCDSVSTRLLCISSWATYTTKEAPAYEIIEHVQFYWKSNPLHFSFSLLPSSNRIRIVFDSVLMMERTWYGNNNISEYSSGPLPGILSVQQQQREEDCPIVWRLNPLATFSSTPTDIHFQHSIPLLSILSCLEKKDNKNIVQYIGSEMLTFEVDLVGATTTMYLHHQLYQLPCIL